MSTDEFWTAPVNLRATLEMSPDKAAEVPRGRAKVRVMEGQVNFDFTVRNRRRLKSGWVRFYLEAAHSPGTGYFRY